MSISKGFVERVYLVTLRVIQPARVQDIFESIPEVFGEKIKGKITKEDIYSVHEQMLERKAIIKVRKGTYCLTKEYWSIVRSYIPSRTLDNRRFFLLKRQRKEYK